jgi:8-oxo-dGTP pyrophosphatase MutT (NUDIX family)
MNHRTPATVVAVVLKTADNQLILQQRDNNPLGEAHLRGKVGFFGGHIEPGETPQATAIREIEEELELNMDPAHLKHIDRFQKEFSVHGDNNFVEVLFYNQPVDPDRLVVHEGADYVLVSPQNQSDINLTPFGTHLIDYIFGRSTFLGKYRR